MSRLDDILNQKQTQVKPVENKTNTDASFSEEEAHRFIDRFISKEETKQKMHRKEKKLIKQMELEPKTLQGIVIGLSVVGVMVLFFMRNMMPSDIFYAATMMLGAVMFLPVGVIIGWILLDPVMRCKMIHKMTKKNYGVVWFVSKSSKMVSKIKNFDNGLIWRNNELWVIAKNRICQMNKDGSTIVGSEKTIDEKNMVTMVDCVPILFLDIESFEPLSLIQSGREPVTPLEIGSNMKAWVDNQRAKMLATRKTMDIVMMAVIGCSIAAVVITVLNLQKIEEMSTMIQLLQDKIQILVEQTQQIP